MEANGVAPSNWEVVETITTAPVSMVNYYNGIHWTVDQPLPNGNHISRYCKPSVIAENGLPMASAFGLRQGEKYLSGNPFGGLEHRC